MLHEGRLIAALEFKSQVGSFGNNFNNRTEEAIGTAHDLWVAYREGAFGKDAPRPFLGWLMLIEDSVDSKTPVTESSPHFAVFPEFRNASYAKRYNLLCEKLVKEQLYTTASVMLSPRTAAHSGEFSEMGELTSLKSFVANFASYIAAEAARSA